ncbi:MAG: hypothetical protein WDW38_003529 [Sanguina aurantia]
MAAAIANERRVSRSMSRLRHSNPSGAREVIAALLQIHGGATDPSSQQPAPHGDQQPLVHNSLASQESGSNGIHHPLDAASVQATVGSAGLDPGATMLGPGGGGSSGHVPAFVEIAEAMASARRGQLTRTQSRLRSSNATDDSGALGAERSPGNGAAVATLLLQHPEEAHASHSPDPAWEACVISPSQEGPLGGSLRSGCHQPTASRLSSGGESNASSPAQRSSSSGGVPQVLPAYLEAGASLAHRRSLISRSSSRLSRTASSQEDEEAGAVLPGGSADLGVASLPAQDRSDGTHTGLHGGAGVTHPMGSGAGGGAHAGGGGAACQAKPWRSSDGSYDLSLPLPMQRSTDAAQEASCQRLQQLCDSERLSTGGVAATPDLDATLSTHRAVYSRTHDQPTQSLRGPAFLGALTAVSSKRLLGRSASRLRPPSACGEDAATGSESNNSGPLSDPHPASAFGVTAGRAALTHAGAQVLADTPWTSNSSGSFALTLSAHSSDGGVPGSSGGNSSAIAATRSDTPLLPSPSAQQQRSGSAAQHALPEDTASHPHPHTGGTQHQQPLQAYNAAGSAAAQQQQQQQRAPPAPAADSPLLAVPGGDRTSNASSPLLTRGDADGEVMLDIEIAGALAPAAKIVVYFTTNTDQGFYNAVAQAAHDATNKPGVISISWGSGENTWAPQGRDALESALQDAVALGITVTVAAGDDGFTDGETGGKPHVDFPSSSPSVLACGGTRLSAAGGKITSEVVWNETAAGDGATGGGVSAVYALPAWQVSAKVPKGSASFKGRGVPDVAGNADPLTGYQVRVDGKDAVYGGTSAVAPLWAALVARLNQSLGRTLGDGHAAF